MNRPRIATFLGVLRFHHPFISSIGVQERRIDDNLTGTACDTESCSGCSWFSNSGVSEDDGGVLDFGLGLGFCLYLSLSLSLSWARHLLSVAWGKVNTLSDLKLKPFLSLVNVAPLVPRKPPSELRSFPAPHEVWNAPDPPQSTSQD